MSDLSAGSAPPLPCDIVEGDIGRLAVDCGPWLAVVSSDDNYLSHGGGCSRAIWRAANLESPDELGIVTPVRIGDVITTKAGNLPAIALFHVVTLDLNTRQALTPDLFEPAMRRLAALATEVRIKHPQEPSRILLPLLGTGSAGVAERIAVEHLVRLSLLVHEAGVRCVVCVPSDLERLLCEFKASFGLGTRNDVLESWLTSLSREPALRIQQLLSGLETLLAHEVSAATGSASPRSLQRMWAFAKEISDRGTPLFDQSDRQRLEEAIDLRNRIAHGVAKPDPLSCHAIEVALRTLVAKSFSPPLVSKDNLRLILGPLNSQSPTPGRAEIASHATETTRELRRSENPVIEFGSPRESSRSPVAATPTPTSEAPIWHQAAAGPVVGHRAEHVNRLVDLLLSLPRDELAHLTETLGELGYKGELRLQIKEYCIRQEPIAILSQFGAVRLKKLLADNFAEVVPAKKSPKWMSRRLLHHLGFRIPGALRSLEAVVGEVSRLESELLATDDPRGLVIKASARLEGCIHDLLRFVCLHLFSHGPEHHFKRHVNGVAASDMGKATLGSLLHCLELLARELEQCAKGDTRKVLRELQGPLTAKRLAPGGVGDISRLRNSFAHFDEEAGDGDHVSAAREFFRNAMSLLRHWADDSARIYPTVIRIDKIIVDEWNRRRIEAVTAEGRRELIVCDKAVEPGGTYFMYPLSNPFRVDPILIEFNP